MKGIKIDGQTYYFHRRFKTREEAELVATRLKRYTGHKDSRIIQKPDSTFHDTHPYIVVATKFHEKYYQLNRLCKFFNGLEYVLEGVYNLNDPYYSRMINHYEDEIKRKGYLTRVEKDVEAGVWLLWREVKDGNKDNLTFRRRT